MERLIDLEINSDGTITSVIEVICTMTGFRMQYMRLDLGEGFFRSDYLSAS